MIPLLLLLAVLGLDRIASSTRLGRPDPVHRCWLRWRPRVVAYIRAAPGTYAYLFVLLVTTWVLQTSSDTIARQLLLERSTNLHQLARDPVRVLFASAFWVSSPWELLLWLVLFSAIVAQVERWQGTERSAAIFFAGHVGATLATALGLWIALRADLVDAAIANTEDVGPSYGFAAVAAALSYRLAGRARATYVLAIVLVAGISLAVSPDFTNWGHLAGAAIGFATLPLARLTARAAGWRRREARGRSRRRGSRGGS